jgi:hypothetical protein
MRKAVAPAAPLVHQAAARAKPAIPPEKVCWIQIVLNKTSGENLEPDGLYGPRTREAARRFQGQYGLSVDGSVGPQTTTALVQIALNQIAQASLLPVNGISDEKLQQEIKRFQSQRKITPDGIVGRHTRAAMVLALGGQCRMPAPAPGRPKSKENGDGSTTCNEVEYARLEKHCGAQAIRYIVNSAIQFGADEKLAIKIAQATFRLARMLRQPHLAVIVAIVGSLGAGILNARAIHRLATAIRDILVGYITCVRSAKGATGC